MSGTKGANTRVAWRELDCQLQVGDILVVAALDRIGRRLQDTMHAVLDLQARKVRIRSLAPTAALWVQYLDAEPGSHGAALGQLSMTFACWVADQESVSLSRRTKVGFNRARARGRSWGRLTISRTTKWEPLLTSTSGVPVRG